MLYNHPQSIKRAFFDGLKVYKKFLFPLLSLAFLSAIVPILPLMVGNYLNLSKNLWVGLTLAVASIALGMFCSF